MPSFLLKLLITFEVTISHNELKFILAKILRINYLVTNEFSSPLTYFEGHMRFIYFLTPFGC